MLCANFPTRHLLSISQAQLSTGNEGNLGDPSLSKGNREIGSKLEDSVSRLKVSKTYSADLQPKPGR